ncbi:glycosyltransferase family 2 protein [Vibrio cionasavignyae]|uniref:glycosyltransferase family 2 protein n=1 Tax=Vibrio cionasavignyae TaxID=2910252 RepID=UPI003D117542
MKINLNQSHNCSMSIKPSESTCPLVSVIIAVYNGQVNLESTLVSIFNQTYQNLEVIVIDGGSSDGTIDIISKYRRRISYYISEPDKGISDAFNKGVKAARGTYINFQGDGDGFWEKDSLDKAMMEVDPKLDLLVGCRIARVSEDGAVLFISNQMNHFSKTSLLFRMSLPHQGLLTHKKFFEDYGLFDVNNKFCMDYEHLLRAYHDFPRVKLQNVILAQWRADGLGNNRELDIYKEYDAIKRKHKLAPSWVLSLVNYWTLLKYNIKMLLQMLKIYRMT